MPNKLLQEREPGCVIKVMLDHGAGGQCFQNRYYWSYWERSRRPIEQHRTISESEKNMSCQAGHYGDQLVRINRFGHVYLESGGQRADAVFGRGVC